LTIVSLLVRLAHINYQSLWLDEGYTLLFSGMPLSKLLTVGGAHEHPPLYYLLVHLLMDLHHSYLIPRFISVLAGSLSIPVLYALGARIFDRGVGIVAAGFLAVSPFHFWFSDDGRAYELAGLFVLLSYLLLFRALDRPRVGLWIAYGASLAACLYTEYTTVLVLLPQGLLLIRAYSRGLARPLLLAWGGAALTFAPWLPTWLHNASTVSDNYWIPNPTWSSLQSVMLEALGLKTTCPSAPCTGNLPPLPLLPGHEGLIAGVAGAAILITLLWAGVHKTFTGLGGCTMVRAALCDRPAPVAPSITVSRSRVSRCHLWSVLSHGMVVDACPATMVTDSGRTSPGDTGRRRTVGIPRNVLQCDERGLEVRHPRFPVRVPNRPIGRLLSRSSAIDRGGISAVTPTSEPATTGLVPPISRRPRLAASIRRQQ